MKIKKNIFTMIWTTLSVVIFTLTQLSICQAEQVSEEPIANIPEVVNRK